MAYLSHSWKGITCHWNHYENQKVVPLCEVEILAVWELKKLVLLQKKIIRIIDGVNSRTSCDPSFEESGFVRFAESNRCMIARFMYRWYLNDIPDSFLYYFTPVSAIHDHCTRQSDGLFIPAFKTYLGKTCLTYRGPYIWNKILKLQINLDSSEVVFTHCVKMVS